MSFKFSMPGLSKYVFHIAGRVQSKHTGHMLQCRSTGLYELWNDLNEKECVYMAEIIQYGKSKEASETKREYLYRVLYDKVVIPQKFKNAKRSKNIFAPHVKPVADL